MNLETEVSIEANECDTAVEGEGERGRASSWGAWGGTAMS